MNASSFRKAALIHAGGRSVIVSTSRAMSCMACNPAVKLFGLRLESRVAFALDRRREALRGAAGIAGGLRRVGLRVGILGPRLQDHLRLQVLDDLAGLAGRSLRGKPADVIGVAMRRNHRSQVPLAVLLN